MVTVIEGDITQVNADALVTSINSGGLWYGGIDRAIMRVAGMQYHSQVGKELQDGQIHLAEGYHRNHTGKFDDVVFIIDDLEQPVQYGFRAALDIIYLEKYTHVVMPAFRCGVMRGVVEPDQKTVAEAIRSELADFKEKFPDFNTTITFVVYGDTETYNIFKAVLE